MWMSTEHGKDVRPFHPWQAEGLLEMCLPQTYQVSAFFPSQAKFRPSQSQWPQVTSGSTLLVVHDLTARITIITIIFLE